MLRDDLGLSYRKIRSEAIHTNSTKSILLRQAWALRFLKPDISNKVLLNIDETWLADTDFRRRKWCTKRKKCTLPRKALTPRISMFAAVDSDGNIFYSVSQANNDSSTMSIFTEQLCAMLDERRRGWRKHTVILIDNAPYHASKEAMQMYEQLKVPIMFMGPYSFDVAPCELLFAHFKS